MKEPTDYLCKDCKHSMVSTIEKILSFGRPASYGYKCKLAFTDAHLEYDAVTGPKKISAKYDYCSVARIDNRKCGKDAKLWEPKHKKDLFKFLAKDNHD